jgi:hypothetical protein
MRHPSSPHTARRPAKVLVLFALLLPVLLGMIGLVVDGGLLMQAQRRAQNAADAAALAAALDLMRGKDTSTAASTANTFLTNNGVNGVTLTLNAGSSNAVNIPPQSGSYANNSNYAEVILSVSVQTLFIQILGVNASQQVTARAVAGFEPVGNGEGAIVLDPYAYPGIAITNNNARLIVNGTLVVNSQGAGVDQYGNSVGTGNQPAIKTSNSTTTPAPVVAQDVQVVGGVDNINNIRAYDPAFTTGGTPNYYYDPNNTDRPLFHTPSVAPDPLVRLETPTTNPSAGSTRVVTTGSYVLNGQTYSATLTSPGTVSIGNSDTATLSPGIYNDIKITGGTVTFNSGIYVLNGNQNQGLSIGGGATVTGSGVMFYATGSSYDPTKSYSPLSNPPADSYNANTTSNASPPGAPTSTTSLTSISINGGTVNLSPVSDSSSPFNGMLIYQARLNTSGLSVGGSSNSVNLTGTAYARWASFALAGQGQYNAQFIVGSMSVSGNAAVTINASGKNFGKANLVFLVE